MATDWLGRSANRILEAAARPAGAARRFATDTGGAVVVIAAAALPLLIGVSALALEYGHGLLIRVENQRNSDIAAFSAARAYAREADPSRKNAAAENAARSIASLNGVEPDDVVIWPAKDVDGGIEIRVDITEELPLMLARVLFREMTGLTINTSALTRIESKAFSKACILALNPHGDGVTVNGGAALSLEAGDCAVAANDRIVVNGNLKHKFPCLSRRVPDNSKEQKYCDWEAGGPFSDPHAGKVIQCDHGPGPLDIGTDGKIEPGTHCIDQSLSLHGNKELSVKGGSGATLVFSDRADLTLTGNNTSLNIQAPTSGPMKGILIYAPESVLRMQAANMNVVCGTASVVAHEIILGGNVDITASCSANDRESHAAESVRLMQ